jgi:hypothetical protein
MQTMTWKTNKTSETGKTSETSQTCETSVRSELFFPKNEDNRYMEDS